MKELIQVIAQALVDAPELVSVREVNASHTTAYELQVVKIWVKSSGKKGAPPKPFAFSWVLSQPKRKGEPSLELSILMARRRRAIPINTCWNCDNKKAHHIDRKCA
jgi:hypothetical protein